MAGLRVTASMNACLLLVATCLLLAAGVSSVRIRTLTLQHYPKPGGTPTDIPYTFYIPDKIDSDLPVIPFFSGGNVDQIWYSSFATRMAKKGYFIITNDYRRPDVPAPPGLPAGCPTTLGAASASTLATLLDYAAAHTEDDKDMEVLSKSSLVAGGHSLGGIAAILSMNTGEGSPNCTNSANALLCQSYGSSPYAERVKGAVVYEGTAANMVIPEGKFFASMCGVNDKDAPANFPSTTGGCAAFARWDKLSHFGITDYTKGPPDQVTTCSVPNADDPANYSISKPVKYYIQDQIINMWDYIIRAQVLKEKKAIKALRAQFASSRISPASWPLLKAERKGTCIW